MGPRAALPRKSAAELLGIAAAPRTARERIPRQAHGRDDAARMARPVVAALVEQHLPPLSA